MTVSRQWVEQVKAVVADIAAARHSAPARETEAWQAFDWNSQALAPAPLDQSVRARHTREITRIAGRYGWQDEVTRALDNANAGTLAALTDSQLEQLVERMRHVLDCAQACCDPAESLPAR